MASPFPQSVQDTASAVAKRISRLLRVGGFRLPAVTLIALGAAVLLLNTAHSMGTIRNPGPGFWPMVCAVLLIVFGVLVFTSDDIHEYEAWDNGSIRVLAAVASLAVFVILFTRVGFIISAALLIFFWLRLLNRESLKSSILYSLIAPFVFYVLFVTILGVPFPFDVIGQIFPRGLI